MERPRHMLVLHSPGHHSSHIIPVGSITGVHLTKGIESVEFPAIDIETIGGNLRIIGTDQPADKKGDGFGYIEQLFNEVRYMMEHPDSHYGVAEYENLQICHRSPEVFKEGEVYSI